MKKIAISVVATIVVLFLLAQTGLLAPFGIKQLSVFREKSATSDEAKNVGEEYYDAASDISYRFKSDNGYFNLYNKGELGWYILRIVRNQMFSDHSPYFYTYVRFRVNSDGLEKVNDLYE